MTSLLLAQCNFIHHMCKTPPRGFFEQQENPQSFLSCQADDNFSHQNQGWCKIFLACNKDKISADKSSLESFFLFTICLVAHQCIAMCCLDEKTGQLFPTSHLLSPTGVPPPFPWAPISQTFVLPQKLIFNYHPTPRHLVGLALYLESSMSGLFFPRMIWFVFLLVIALSSSY